MANADAESRQHVIRLREYIEYGTALRAALLDTPEADTLFQTVITETLAARAHPARSYRAQASQRRVIDLLWQTVAEVLRDGTQPDLAGLRPLDILDLLLWQCLREVRPELTSGERIRIKAGELPDHLFDSAPSAVSPSPQTVAEPAAVPCCGLAKWTAADPQATFQALPRVDRRLSMNDLAAQLACSRSAVARHIGHLRADWKRIKAGTS